MIAPLGFFNVVQVLVELLLRKKGSPVNALQLGILLIAQPIGAGDIQQLERLDLARRWNVRSATEVGEFASAVNRNLFIGPGELLNEVALHEVAFFFELLQALVAREKLTSVRNMLLHQLLHLLFDLLQVLWSERSRT